MVATPTAVVHPSIAEEPAASITLSPPTESELKAEAAEAARAGARAGVVVMSGTLYCRGGRMFSLFRPQSVSLVAERGGHATARAVGSRRRRGSNQRRPSAVPLERQHWLVFGNNNHPVHGDAHCVVVRCADFVKVTLEMTISTPYRSPPTTYRSAHYSLGARHGQEAPRDDNLRSLLLTAYHPPRITH